jgi:hypothetical protein
VEVRVGSAPSADMLWSPELQLARLMWRLRSVAMNCMLRSGQHRMACGWCNRPAAHKPTAHLGHMSFLRTVVVVAFNLWVADDRVGQPWAAVPLGASHKRCQLLRCARGCQLDPAMLSVKLRRPSSLFQPCY